MNSYSEKGLLPAGLADMLPPAAAAEAELSENLMQVFKLNGYLRVKPPLIEFEEHLLEGAGEALSAKMFRVMDPVSHRMMGIRTDMTPQVARIATTRLKQEPRPLRLSYAGQVLRVYGGQLRPERQFAQAGVELIGAEEISADAELILLAAEAVERVGIKRFSIDLTLPTLLPTICEEIGIEDNRAAEARDALDQKDAAALAEFGETLSPILTALLDASGPAAPALKRLENISLPKKATEQVSQLRNLVSMLEAAAPGLVLTIDPGEYRGFEYQTGISFTLFAHNVRGELGRGGRYHLLDGECATGFTLFMDSLLRAVPKRKADKRIYLPLGTPRPEAIKLKAEGWIVIPELKETSDQKSNARKAGCSHIFIDGSAEALA